MRGIERSNPKLLALNAVLWMACAVLTVALVADRSSEPADEVPAAPAPLPPKPADATVEEWGNEAAPVVMVAVGEGRDPFRPPRVWNEVDPPVIPGGVACRSSGHAHARVELSSLRLEAVARMERAPSRALVTAPNGSGVILSEGDIVGRECARIVRIEPEQLMLEVSDGRNRVLIELRLRPESPDAMIEI